MAVRVSLVAASAPLLLLASVLLVGSLAYTLGHLDTGSEALPNFPPIRGAPGGGPAAPTDGGQSTRGIFLALLWMMIGLAIAAVLYVKLSGGKLSSVITVWELAGYLFAPLLLLAIWFFWPEISAGIQSLLPGGQPNPPRGGAGPGGFGPGQSSDPPTGFLILGIVVAAVFIAALAVQVAGFMRAMVRKTPPRETPRETAAKVVARTIQDLQAGGDYRAAVIRCYSELCALLATRGVRSQAALTAREIESEARRQLGLSDRSLPPLTVLFEEARYSRHEIGAAQRDGALAALRGVKSELEGSPRPSA